MGGQVQEERLIFSDKQEKVFELLESPDNRHVTEVFFGGAAGGGKSFLGCHWQIERRISFPGTRGLIGRESLKNLKLTTFKTFCDVWDEFYRDNPWGITWKVNWQTNLVEFSNRSEIVLMDLGHYPSDPEYHRLGSLEITDAFIDELPEIKKKAFEILQSRIRYKIEMVGDAPKCLATGNPAMNWVRARYVKDNDGNQVNLKAHQAYIRATVQDNPDEAFRETYIAALEKLSPIDMARLLHGDWDAQGNENPWAWALKRSKHYTHQVYQPSKNYPLDLSFDFNHDPCVCIIGQVQHHVPHYAIIGYIKASSGTESAIKQLCDRIKTMFPHHAATRQLTITGDASGTARDASRPATTSRYTEICRYLGINEAAVKIERANVTHKASRDLCNAALHQIPDGGYLFYGGQGCEMLLSEIEAAFPDNDESLNKYKKEAGGHGVDAWRYLMQLWYAHRLTGARFREYQQFIDSIVRRLKK